MKILLVILLFIVNAWTQDYTWPTNLGKHLSSNFGEFRTTGYHQGLDIKTKGSIVILCLLFLMDIYQESYQIFRVLVEHYISL